MDRLNSDDDHCGRKRVLNEDGDCDQWKGVKSKDPIETAFQILSQMTGDEVLGDSGRPEPASEAWQPLTTDQSAAVYCLEETDRSSPRPSALTISAPHYQTDIYLAYSDQYCYQTLPGVYPDGYELSQPEPCLTPEDTETPSTGGGQQIPANGTYTVTGEKIRRPPNAFMIFAKERHREILYSHQAITNKEASKRLGAQWQALPDQAKAHYHELALQFRKEHESKYPGKRDWSGKLETHLTY